MPRFMWLAALRSSYLALRILLFEYYRFLILFFWLMFTAGFVLMAGAVHWGAAVSVVLLALLLYRRFAQWFYGRRYRLIRKGDQVEYSCDKGGKIHFESGTVLYVLTPEEVVKTGRFSAEEAVEFERFYLLKGKKQNEIIPYEWISTLEIDDTIDMAAS